MFSLLLAVIYLAFVSLGLPDSLLGSAWPAIYPELGVPVSWAGGISMIIAGGTIFSSLQSDRLTRRLGTGRVTAFSVALTAAALFGFSVSGSFWQLCLWAVPYGLGAGSVDAALNNYVAVHYASRHMSWLHCMWGVGASVGPSILGFAMAGGGGGGGGGRGEAPYHSGDPPHPRHQGGDAHLLLLLRPGEHRHPMEQQLPCPAPGHSGGAGGGLRQPLFHRHYGGAGGKRFFDHSL